MSEGDASEETVEQSPSEEANENNDVVFRVMTVGSVRFDLGDSSPQIHLMEEDSPYRNVSIAVALAEAQSLHNALIGAVVGEMMASNKGLGYLIQAAAGQYDTAGVFAALLGIVTVDDAIDAIIPEKMRTSLPRFTRHRPKPPKTTAAG